MVKRFWVLLACVVAISGCKPVGSADSLKPFANEAAMMAWLKKADAAAPNGLAEGEAAPADAAAAGAAPGITGSSPSEPPPKSITNNQVDGVDEGGIVKQMGRFLVTLKEGRLFVADMGQGVGAPLRLTDRLNVYTSTDSAADWYDEMLVSGNRILVTAYSYKEGGSEISLFKLDETGRLSRDGRYVLESYDYFSGENYATRLVGGKLVFYAPYPAYLLNQAGPKKWPRLRRADGDKAQTPLFRPTDIYAPDAVPYDPVLHLVSTCTLEKVLSCTATGLMGSASREMFVAQDAVYLWSEANQGGNTPPWDAPPEAHPANCRDGGAIVRDQDRSVVARIPLGAGAPGFVLIEGRPLNQFSFVEQQDQLRIVLFRSAQTCTEANQDVERRTLLSLPVNAFGASTKPVGASNYTPLPDTPRGDTENRFIGDWLIVAANQQERYDRQGQLLPQRAGADLLLVPLKNPASARRVTLDHDVSRIEAMGQSAMLVGPKGHDLKVSLVDPAARQAWLLATTLLPNRTEAETRSHAFSARTDANGAALFAFPTSPFRRAGPIWTEEDMPKSDLDWFRYEGGPLKQAGRLSIVQSQPARGYACEVSCIDWYGETRPIFIGGRIFGLMGTELVEAVFEGGQVQARARLDLTGPTAVHR